MLDIPYSLDTYQRIPKNRWHPSLYPQISLVTLKTITQKKEDNWFYLSAPICTQWGFYFSPTSQTVEDANIWTKNTYVKIDAVMVKPVREQNTHVDIFKLAALFAHAVNAAKPLFQS